MVDRNRRIQLVLEIMLVLISLAVTCLLYIMAGHKIIVLNLYNMPVVLAALFLGRYRAGVLTLLCVVAALVITVLDLENFAAFSSPLAATIAVTVWGATLGLTALVVGTLSDERTRRLDELHDAYLGIVEVLSSYLNSADLGFKNRASRVSELCRRVALQLRLSADEVDDVRVAGMLRDMEHIEVTARVMEKAMGDLGSRPRGAAAQCTFRGADLVQSLGAVLARALPLLVDPSEVAPADSRKTARSAKVPFGSEIIRTVRAFDSLVYGDREQCRQEVNQAIRCLRADADADHHPAVLEALEQVVGTGKSAPRVLAWS